MNLDRVAHARFALYFLAHQRDRLLGPVFVLEHRENELVKVVKGVCTRLLLEEEPLYGALVVVHEYEVLEGLVILLEPTMGEHGLGTHAVLGLGIEHQG